MKEDVVVALRFSIVVWEPGAAAAEMKDNL